MIKVVFFLRLFLLLVAHTILIVAFIKMAKRNPSDLPKQKHLAIKILGFVLATLGVLEGIGGVYLLSQIPYPLVSQEMHVSVNAIIRPASQTLYWGELTTPQYQCLTLISGAFKFFAISSYCIYFRPSDSKWWGKLGKVLFCIILIRMCDMSTDFHYFDFYEWIFTVIYVIMLSFAFREKKKIDNGEVPMAIVKEEKVEETPAPFRNKEDETRFMPKGMLMADNSPNKVLPVSIDGPEETESRIIQTSEVSIDDKVVNQDNAAEEGKEENCVDSDYVAKKETGSSIDEENTHSGQVRIFCRFCGNIVNYETDAYCKHCGNKL